ncbi:MAG: methyltransferase domain-containing protein [Actinomycetota bacterium]|nr:methyltransferase domain-containing protein [Actinomycetota bacterium]
MTDWQLRAQHLVDELTAAGKLWSPQWRQAVAQVPRHELLPAYYEYTPEGWQAADTTTPQGRKRWLERVYSNTALFTLPEGRSSSSMPALMTRMLEALDVHDGHRVLEIGTGSGYNAALLCHRLGHANVHSVDIETELVELARDRLAKLGYRPTLSVGDGEHGLAEHAPYDRIIATCSVPAIPWPWVQQTCVSGLILVDLRLQGYAGNLVLLRRHEDRAEGRFDARYGSFMPMRHTAPPDRPAYPKRERSHAAHCTTRLDLPRPWEHLVFWFFVHIDAGLAIGSHGQTMDPDTGQPGDAFLSSPDGSWCEISAHIDARGARRVWQSGPRRLWDKIEIAHDQWTKLGRPSWERFGLTVTEHHHTVWLDSRHSDHSWRVS